MRLPVHRRHASHRWGTVIGVAALSVALMATTVGCAARSSSPPDATSTHTAATTASGPVTVLYAGSLVDLMQKQIGPAFHAATGYTFTGISGGSSALATQIRGGVNAADVFVSASPAVNDTLTGSKNGGWVSWYATFASSPLVLGYNPKSTSAAALKSTPWYDVITRPGILIGRTDPATDPKGALTVQALTDTAAAKKVPGLKAIASSTSTVFPEETLVGRLQAGQLDAGFFYSSEAEAAGIPTVPLTGVDLKATYTVTVLNRARHPAAAAAFVEYLLGAHGRAALKKDAFELTTPPAVTGSGVPAGLNALLGG